MEKYRIIERVGEKTGTAKVYIQERKKRLFRKYKWKILSKFDMQSGISEIMVFNSVADAREWLDFHTEKANYTYHKY